MAIRINITAQVSNLVKIRQDIEKQLQNIKMTVGAADQTVKKTSVAGAGRTKTLTQEEKNAKAAAKAVKELTNEYSASILKRKEFIQQGQGLLTVLKQVNGTTEARARLVTKVRAAIKGEMNEYIRGEKAKLKQIKETQRAKNQLETTSKNQFSKARTLYNQQISQLKAVNRAYQQGKISAEAFSSSILKIAQNVKSQASAIKRLSGDTRQLDQINKQMSTTLSNTFKKQISSINELIQKYRQGKITTTDFKNATQEITNNLRQQESTVKALGGDYQALANSRKQISQTIKEEISLRQQANKETYAQMESERRLAEKTRLENQARQERLKIQNAINNLKTGRISEQTSKEIRNQQVFNAVAKESLELFKARKISAQEFMAITNQLMARTNQYGQIDNKVSAQIYRNRLLVQNAQERLRNGMANQNDLLLLQANRYEQVSGKMRGFISNMGMIIKKFADWIIVAQLIFLPLRTIQDAVKTIREMDDALTDLNKVVDLSKSQLNDMRAEAIQLGKEMGISATEIMRGMAEFGRIAKVKEDIIELTRVATIASNVTTLSADEAAKAIISTMITFKKEVSDVSAIVDSFNEVQNNFRVSAEDLANSVSKVGVVAYQTGVSLEQLEGYTAAIAQSMSISGSEIGNALNNWGLVA